MDKNYKLIIFYYLIIKGLILNDGLSHLDHLLQESLRYLHDKENYKIILQEEILTTGLKIKRNLDLYLWQDSLIKNEIPYFLMLRRAWRNYY